MLKYKSVAEFIEAANKAGKTIGEIVLADQAVQMERTEQEVFDKMANDFEVMCQSVIVGQDPDIKSTSGLTGGEGYKMKAYGEKTKGGLMGEFMAQAMSRALAVSSCNAAMGRIVAAPTAGSCGILPGCLVSLYEDKKYDKHKIVMSMFTAAAYGLVIATNSSIAGAQGGCQAECGSAAGMAAAALVELAGGTPEQTGHACAMAISNQLGLVCDPVAGLVEIPCIKRNVAGTVVAFSSADMALAGIKAAIPVDEVIDAMKEVGDSMPCSLKETAGGGLATTPTGIRLKEQVFGKD